MLIRYADDFVVHCHTRQEALEVKARLAAWLTPRGLAFNEDKTQVVSLGEGFDFLGFNVRRYRRQAADQTQHKRPSDESGEGSATSCAPCAGATPPRCSSASTRSSAGWAAYYRTQVSAEAFGKLDYYLWRLTWKWAKISHSTKPAYWVFARYFGTFNKARQDRWVFGDRTSGSYLHRFAWTNIVRHQIVKHAASPDDPELADYWAWRRRKAPLPINRTAMRLYRAQDGRCAICKTTLLAASAPPTTLHATGSTGWPPLARRSMSSGTQPTRTPLNPASSTSTATTTTASHQGLLEPDARKRARPVVCPADGYVERVLEGQCFPCSARFGGVIPST